MVKTTGARFKLQVRSENGGLMEAHGPCSEREAWALWMLQCFMGMKPSDLKKKELHVLDMLEAAQRYIDSAWRYREACSREQEREKAGELEEPEKKASRPKKPQKKA
jgi:hypothetical protein